MFAYPPILSTTTAATVTRAPTAVLSTTAKRKKKDAEKKKKEGDNGGDAKDMAMETDDPKGDVETEPPPKEPEPTSETLSNPCRVVAAQQKYIRFPSSLRYVPMKKVCMPSAVLFLSTG